MRGLALDVLKKPGSMAMVMVVLKVAVLVVVLGLSWRQLELSHALAAFLAIDLYDSIRKVIDTKKC